MRLAEAEERIDGVPDERRHILMPHALTSKQACSTAPAHDGAQPRLEEPRHLELPLPVLVTVAADVADSGDHCQEGGARPRR